MLGKLFAFFGKNTKTTEIPGKLYKGFFVDIKNVNGKTEITVFNKLGKKVLERTHELMDVGNKKVFHKVTTVENTSKPSHLNDYLGETDLHKTVIDTVKDAEGRFLGKRIAKTQETIQIKEGLNSYDLASPYIKSKEVSIITPNKNVTTKYSRGDCLRTCRINNLTGQITNYPRI